VGRHVSPLLHWGGTVGNCLFLWRVPRMQSNQEAAHALSADLRWGQHMHHGYYEAGKQVSNQQAQIDMIERTLDWARVTSVRNVRLAGNDLRSAAVERARMGPAYHTYQPQPPTWPGRLCVTMQTVDVGCGIGGSSRHIAAKYGSSGKGVTLSPVQVHTPLPTCPLQPK
jgi:hypothetical protein